MTDIPSEEEVLGYAETLSNWGRWGADDERGTLNFITDEKRLAAMARVQLGRAVSLAWDIDTGPPGSDVKIPPQRWMVRTGQGLGEDGKVERQVALQEFIGMIYHGRRITHLDSPAHIIYNGKMYNDQPGWLVTSDKGAKRNSVLAAREGIVTRGVLLDAPKHRNQPWIDPILPVHRSEVEAMLEEEGVELQDGDALILRTGYGRYRTENGPKWDGTQPGWGASCLPFFKEHSVSVIACDTSGENHPSGYKNFRGPIHGIGIGAMGLWLVDNCNLEAIAAACAEVGRYDFAFVVGPIPFIGALGSPVNPIALL